MNNYIVYCHTNKINNKRYVGITNTSVYRRRQNGANYKGNEDFNKDINQYGWEEFTHEILFTNLSQEEAENTEIQLIKKWNLLDNRYGYNKDKGGKHYNFSNEIKDKMSKDRKGKGYWLGKQMPKEARELMSFRKKGIVPKSNPPKQVKCIETNEIFNSLSETARRFDCSPALVHRSCNNLIKSKRKDCFPYTFQYVETTEVIYE